MRAIFSHSFNKTLSQLNQKIQTAFYARLNLFLKEPFHPLLNNHTLHGVYAKKRSINITGDYRAIFIQDRTVAIFTDIGTHSKLYQ